MKSVTRLAVVEHDAKVRRKIVATLESRAGWSVVAACASAEEARAKIPRAQPDLLLLDIRLPPASGLDLILPLRAALPGLQVVMLTVVEDTDDILRAIDARACGYLLKTDANNLVQDIETVLAGGAPVMSTAVARQLWRHREKQTSDPGSGLSPPRTGSPATRDAGQTTQGNRPGPRDQRAYGPNPLPPHLRKDRRFLAARSHGPAQRHPAPRPTAWQTGHGTLTGFTGLAE